MARDRGQASLAASWGMCIGGGGILLMLSAGCAPRPVPTSPAPSGAALAVSLQIVPTRPRQLDPTQFQVQVRDHAGKFVKEAVVTADLTMPEMDMGRNQAALKSDGMGSYLGTGRFTMPGRWQVTVHAARGRDTAQAFYWVNVR